MKNIILLIDNWKRSWFEAAGIGQAALLTDAIRLENTREDLILLRKNLNGKVQP